MNEFLMWQSQMTQVLSQRSFKFDAYTMDYTHLPVFGTHNEDSALVVGAAFQRLGIQATNLLRLVLVDWLIGLGVMGEKPQKQRVSIISIQIQ